MVVASSEEGRGAARRLRWSREGVARLRRPVRIDEAARLRGVIGGDGGASSAGGEWRGTVVVPGAGHASTLGNRVDLLEEIRTAFEDTGGELRLSSRESVPQLPAGNPGTGWDRFMLDRNYPGLDPKDYTRYVRGGDLSGLAGLAPLEEAEKQ